MIPSRFQEKIYDWVTNGNGDCVVQAVAGSGKTTTLVEVGKRIKGKAVFLAFNTHVKDELKSRLPDNIKVYTLHSLGNYTLCKALGKFNVVVTKYNKICREIVENYLRQNTVDIDKHLLITQLKDLVNFCRLTLTEPSDAAAVGRMIEDYEIECTELNLLFPMIKVTIDEGNNIARLRREIDFTDQIYLPWKWQLQPPKFDWTLVDESQDLNSAQLDLALKCARPGGRRMFVGDSRQAIYAFCGANHDSIDRIIDRTDAVTLPLSICYRCPRSHITLAQKLVPAIEPADNAVEGLIDDIEYEDIFGVVKEGDLILCRKTAPLVALCIQLIVKRIPAAVKGKDIGKQLCGVIDEIADVPGFLYNTFGDYIDRYFQEKVARLAGRDDAEEMIETLVDKTEAIRTCYESFINCRNVDCLKRELNDLFSDERSSVFLSTVHRAKGLENDDVFILDPDSLPLRWKGQKEEALVQEYNLKYVALTRAKRSLTFVAAQPKKKKSLVTSVGYQQDDDDDDDF